VLDRNVESVDDADVSACRATSPTRLRLSAAIAAVVEHFGALDIVVNNAGIGAEGDIAANEVDEWARVLDVNVVGLARVSRARAAPSRASQHASIVNTCSVAGVIGIRNRALYSASKGRSRPSPSPWPPTTSVKAYRVNAVTPGTADTPWVGRLLDHGR
jgi:NAD(P)-dependent dehydrogenase (short-subunit alcohol dehydrogenase family)